MLNQLNILSGEDAVYKANQYYSDLEKGDKENGIVPYKNAYVQLTALYNFYAASEVDEASLHKA